MTIEQFLKEVKATKRKFVCKNNMIRTRGHRQTYCPIEAVAKKKFGRSDGYYYDMLDLGLGSTNGYRIVKAADMPNAKYRKALAQACGVAQ